MLMNLSAWNVYHGTISHSKKNNAFRSMKSVRNITLKMGIAIIANMGICQFQENASW